MIRQRLSDRVVVVAGLLVALAGFAACSGGSAVPPPAPVTADAAPAGLERIAGLPARGGLVMSPALNAKIKHIIIIVQENRTLDNMFHGYPGATYATTGKNSTGDTITLQPEPLAVPYDWTHRFPQAVTAVDYAKGESMDGFDQTPCGGSCPTIPPCNKYGCNSQYQYVQQSDVQGYWNMAQQYVLADHFFSSQLDGSFEGHQYLIAGQSEAAWGIPTNGSIWGCDGGASNTIELLNTATKPGTTTTNKLQVCFDPPVTKTLDKTIADELDAKKLTWRYYAPGMGKDPGYIWSAYDAINHIRNGPEWTTNVISPASQFELDVPNGILANVTWITPTLTNSDHAGSNSKTGPAWVATLVDTVGNSQFWDSSAIFVTWDDWGGPYDSVPPPLLDYNGLGIRVPLIAISPYALKNKVAKTQYEFGSILKFIEKTYGLKALAASDARAATFGKDVFNFKQKPRAFVPFASQQMRSEILSQRDQNVPPDDDGP